MRLPSLAAPPSASPVWLRGYLALASATSALGRARLVSLAGVPASLKLGRSARFDPRRAGKAAARASANGLQTVRSFALAGLTWLFSAVLALALLAQRRSVAVAERARLALSHGQARARSSAALVSSYLRRQQRLQRARVRYLVGSLVITLRNVHFRQHASSLLIATCILIAVARAQTSSDGR